MFAPIRRPFTAAVVAALLAPAAARADADPIAAALKEKAPAVIDHLKRKGFKNVGVLKFLVRDKDGQLRDDVGDLNLSLANKTEVALILANTDDRFGIIDKASEFVVRERMARANHRTPEGRRAFFERKFDLAWSKEKVEPSGFVTGLVTVSDDLTRMTIRLQAFDRSGVLEDLPGEISAPAEPETLAEAGLSYALPPARVKALVAGEPLPPREQRRAEALEGMLRVSRPASDPGLAAPTEPFAPLTDSPVKWTVLYNGKPVPVVGNRVPEPGPTDRVEFVLKNPGPGTYAAVLLVNGENTLYEERAAPLACRKWVLPPGAEVTIKGFQTEQDKVVPFKVLPPEEPLPDAVRYGEHAGTFRLVVYHGTTSAADPGSETKVHLDRDEAAALAIARTRGATRPAGVKPQSLKALQAELRGRSASAEGSRGFVVKGAAAEKFETQQVFFAPSSDLPVADVSLRYFTPRK
jgi:hypothetical protein